MTPTIETPRLVLRPWTDADREPWVAMCADPRVMEMLGGVLPRERALETAERLARRLVTDGYGWWVVDVRGGTMCVGRIILQDVPFEATFTPAFEIGWRFTHDVWGHGYATEAARAMLDFAFTTLGKHEVVALTARINTRSQRVMDRLGMTYDPASDFANPRYEMGHPLHDSVLYRIRKERFPDHLK